MKDLVSLIYAVFLGFALVLFVGTGTATFYPEPEYPVDTDIPVYEQASMTEAEEKQRNEEWQEEYEQYDAKRAVYDRNVAMIAMGFAVLFLVIGVSKSDKLGVLGEGALFGGMFTLFYSMIRGARGDDMSQFLVLSLGLLVAIAVGYWKFVLPGKKKSSK